MRVLMIEHFSPGNEYTQELIQELGRLTEIDVACKKNAKDFRANSVLKILYSRRKEKIRAFLEYGISLFKLYYIIWKNKYDVVHVQTFKNAKIEIPMYMYLRKNCILVHTVHNLLPHEVSAGDKELYEEFYNRCDALIVHNNVCKEQLVAKFNIDAQKISVIPHGTYTNQNVKFDYNRKTQNEKKVFLLFGAVRQYKGVDVFLEAISKLPLSVRRNAKFIVAGRQDKRQDPNDYEAMIRQLDVADCTEFINRRIDDAELPELFESADFCVFPYKEIYGSGALLMAYTYNKPVITSDVPVFVEETDDGKAGMLFKSENPESLAQAIQEALNWKKEDYCACQAKISELVENKYNWAISAKKTVEVYNNITQVK